MEAKRDWPLPQDNTLLIVDDDYELSDGLRTVLEKQGHRVLQARDGNLFDYFYQKPEQIAPQSRPDAKPGCATNIVIPRNIATRLPRYATGLPATTSTMCGHSPQPCLSPRFA